MEPFTIGAIAVGGVGGVLLLRQRAKAKALAAAKAQVAATGPVISPNATPAQVAANQAALAANIQAGLANGTVKLGTNGVPFSTTSPFDPSKTPAQLLNPDGTLALIVTDFVTVNNDLLASSLVQGAGNVPGFAPGENILMQIVSIADPRVGPIMAISKDPRLTLNAPIGIQPVMITGVQPAQDAAQSAAVIKN